LRAPGPAAVLALILGDVVEATVALQAIDAQVVALEEESFDGNVGHIDSERALVLEIAERDAHAALRALLQADLILGLELEDLPSRLRKSCSPP